MVEEVKEKEQKVIQLEDGTILNEYCQNKQFSHEVNIEAVYDLLDVITKNIKLQVIKNDDGFVTDVSLKIPVCDDFLAVLAQKNVIEFSQKRNNSEIEISDEEFLRLRRKKVEEFIKISE
jgi:hypothetical protein